MNNTLTVIDITALNTKPIILTIIIFWICGLLCGTLYCKYKKRINLCKKNDDELLHWTLDEPEDNDTYNIIIHKNPKAQINFM